MRCIINYRKSTLTARLLLARLSHLLQSACCYLRTIGLRPFLGENRRRRHRSCATPGSGYSRAPESFPGWWWCILFRVRVESGLVGLWGWILAASWLIRLLLVWLVWLPGEPRRDCSFWIRNNILLYCAPYTVNECALVQCTYTLLFWWILSVPVPCVWRIHEEELLSSIFVIEKNCTCTRYIAPTNRRWFISIFESRCEPSVWC